MVIIDCLNLMIHFILLTLWLSPLFKHMRSCRSFAMSTTFKTGCQMIKMFIRSSANTKVISTAFLFRKLCFLDLYVDLRIILGPSRAWSFRSWYWYIVTVIVLRISFMNLLLFQNLFLFLARFRCTLQVYLVHTFILFFIIANFG